MDDEEIIRNVAKEMLEPEGYSIEFAAEGREAIDMYKKSINKKQSKRRHRVLGMEYYSTIIKRERGNRRLHRN